MEKVKKFFNSLHNAFIALCLFMFMHVKVVTLTLYHNFEDNFIRPFDGILKSRKRIRRLRHRKRKIISLKLQKWFRLKISTPIRKRPWFKRPKKVHHPRGQPFWRNFVLNQKQNVETRSLDDIEIVKLKERNKRLKKWFHKKYIM